MNQEKYDMECLLSELKETLKKYTFIEEKTLHDVGQNCMIGYMLKNEIQSIIDRCAINKRRGLPYNTPIKK